MSSSLVQSSLNRGRVSSGLSVNRSSANTRWINIIPKTQFFGTYTQSILDAIDVSSRKPTNIKVRVEGLENTNFNVYVQESLKNEDLSYANSSTPPVSISVFDSDPAINTTRVQKLNLVGNWMRIKIELLQAGTTSNRQSVSVQIDISY